MRRRTRGRLEAIGEAALLTFTRQGVRRTQMADVAREAGVSVGTLYLYAGNKEALLELAFRSALGDLPAEEALPLAATSVAGLLPMLAGAVARRTCWPCLRQALGVTAPADIGRELEQVLGELFDITAAERRLIWLLGACAVDAPELASLYEDRMKGAYIADLERYVRARVEQGCLRDDLEPAAAARVVMEAVVWAAMHRHRDLMPPIAGDAAMRTAALAIAAAGLRSGR